MRCLISPASSYASASTAACFSADRCSISVRIRSVSDRSTVPADSRSRADAWSIRSIALSGRRYSLM